MILEDGGLTHDRAIVGRDVVASVVDDAKVVIGPLDERLLGLVQGQLRDVGFKHRGGVVAVIEGVRIHAHVEVQVSLGCGLGRTQAEQTVTHNACACVEGTDAW